MQVFLSYIFVLLVFYNFELTSSKDVLGQVSERNTTENFLDSNKFSSETNSTKRSSGPEADSSRPRTEGTKTTTRTLLLAELERKMLDLSSKLKQMSDQLTLEWNRDSMLQAVLAADRSLSVLKHLNHQDLPQMVRMKVEKLEQSVENIKTTVYHLIQSQNVQLHNFTGKIGNNKASLERLGQWVESFTSHVVTLQRTHHFSTEVLEKVSSHLVFELKQIMVFADRIGREYLPIELRNKLKSLQEAVSDFVNRRLKNIDKHPESLLNHSRQDQESFAQLKSRIMSLQTDIITFERLEIYEQTSWLYEGMKEELARIILEVSKPNVPDFLISAAKDLKNRFLAAEKRYLSSQKTSEQFNESHSSLKQKGNTTDTTARIMNRLARLENVLDDIGAKLSINSSVSTLTEILESLGNILAESAEMNYTNYTKEVRNKLFMIIQRAIKYKRLATSVMAYYKNPETVGVDKKLIEKPKIFKTTFEDTFRVLKHEFEHLKNLFYLKQDLKVMLTIKYLTGNIIKHLVYLKDLRTTGPLQRGMSELLLRDVQNFLQHVGLSIADEMLNHPQNENVSSGFNPGGTEMETDPSNAGSQPEKTIMEKLNETDEEITLYEEILENLTTLLRETNIQLNYPLNIASLREICKTLLRMFNELQILQDGSIQSDVSKDRVIQLKQSCMEYILLIVLTTQGETDETDKFFTVNNESNDLHNKIDHLETYFEELRYRITFFDSSLIDINYAIALLVNLRELQKSKLPRRFEDSKANSPLAELPVEQNIPKDIQTDSNKESKNILSPEMIREKLDILRRFFMRLVDRASSSMKVSLNEVYRTQLEKVLRELEFLKHLDAVSEDVMREIEDLEKDLKSFNMILDAPLDSSRNYQNISQSDSQPSLNPYNKDNGNVEFENTVKSISSELVAARTLIANENSLSKVRRMNVRIHRILLEVMMMRWKVPRHMQDQIEKLEEFAKTLINEIEYRIVEIRKLQSGLWEITNEGPTIRRPKEPYTPPKIYDKINEIELGEVKKHPNRNPHDQPTLSYSSTHEIYDKINDVENVLNELKTHPNRNPHDRSTTLSYLSYRLENLIQELGTLKSQTGQENPDLILKLLFDRVRCVQDKLTQEMRNSKKSGQAKIFRTSVESHINQLDRYLNYLSAEMLHRQNHINVIQVRRELRRLQLNLMHLKALGLPRRFQTRIKYLLEMGKDLGMRLDQAATGKIRILKYPLKMFYRANKGFNNVTQQMRSQ